MKQKRLTREEILSAVDQKIDAQNERRRQRSERYAEMILRKLARGKFQIHKTFRRYPTTPVLKVRLWFAWGYDSEYLIEILRDHGYKGAEINEFAGLLGETLIEIPIITRGEE